ncbi:PucR family transcriptional regulator, partial [Nonomuraea sp. NPDC005983]|uniref:PucR family transcriptional regulator n=1 Tax=Nonomuraea sp. NPDC005983 TaxID=3155595 RepID=UPI0033B133D5
MTNDAIARLALRCLAGYEDLIDDWLGQVMEIEPYARGLVSPEEVREGARVGFALILRNLAEGRVPPEQAPHSERMGERRAGQGVPLESLLAAARLDARVLWQGLVDHAGPEDVSGLLQAANLVWEAVEEHNTGLMTGYQRGVLEMGRQREDERRTWFARLLDNDGRNPDVVRDAGRVLGFDPAATFVAVVADSSAGAALRAAAASMASLRRHRHDSPIGGILVVQLPARAPDPEQAVIDALAGVPCGVSPQVAGLSQVPHAVRLATATARAALPYRPRGDADGPETGESGGAGGGGMARD